MGCVKLEYRSGLPCPSPGDPPDPGIPFLSLVSPVTSPTGLLGMPIKLILRYYFLKHFLTAFSYIGGQIQTSRLGYEAHLLSLHP